MSRPMTLPVKHGNWTLILPLAGLGLAYLFLFFLPSQRLFDSLGKDLSKQLDAVSRADVLIPAIALTTRQLDASCTYNRRWIEATPSESELPHLFAKVNALAKAAGITTTRLSPQPAVQYEKIRSVTLTAGYRGSFSQVCRFLCDLESISESIWIDQVQMEGDGKNGKDISCEVSLVVFVDKTDESDQVKGSG
jgi:hypothetical protein